MGDNGLKENEQYYLIPNYTMKCRLYPNKETAQKIDNILHAMKVAHNAALYDTFVNKANTNKWVNPESGETVHFPNTSGMAKASYINKLKEMHPVISSIPAGSLQGNNGIFLCDVQKMLESQVGEEEDTKNNKKPKSNKKSDKQGKKKKVVRPIESSEPHYYSKSHPRMSYTYQQYCSSIAAGDNKNVFYINLSKVGEVKVRGWNQKIRFGDEHTMDFLQYAAQNQKNRITVTVKKDNCNDYWICFKLNGVYKPMKSKPVNAHIGVDVGIKDIAILSDGTKYENKRFNQQEKKHLAALNRRMSRRNGYENEKFRKTMKQDPSIQVSKRYEFTRLKYAKLNRKIAEKRKNYNNYVSKQIVAEHDFIGVESLNVSGMMRNRYLANSLADASMGQLLQMLGYKSGWYGRTIQPINQWKPSSKRCSCCGYIRPKLSLSIREWTCPVCNEHHDRDMNAAQNIEQYALETYLNQ